MTMTCPHALTPQSLPEAGAFVDFLNTRVVFHNTMVDRITSHREGEIEVANIL